MTGDVVRFGVYGPEGWRRGLVCGLEGERGAHRTVRLPEGLELAAGESLWLELPPAGEGLEPVTPLRIPVSL